jgi:hypothetical protein
VKGRQILKKDVIDRGVENGRQSDGKGLTKKKRGPGGSGEKK